MTQEELEIEVKSDLNFIDDKLGEQNSPSAEDIEGVVGYGMELAAIISLTGKTFASAKKLLNLKELNYMNENRDMWNKPTVMKKLMEGELADYYAMVTWADRLIAACTHKMDFYRSVISKYKAEISLNQQFNQQRN